MVRYRKIPEPRDGPPPPRRQNSNNHGISKQQNKSETVQKLYLEASDSPSDWMPSTTAVLKMMLSLRFSAGLWSTIQDCDEVFNYWEPLHLLLFGKGLQTWEYSPLYAIRSYLYIGLHYIPASFLAMLFSHTKVAIFVITRCLLAALCASAEFYLFKAICERHSIRIGRFFLLFSIFSSGMFISCSSFLPSTFSMVLNTYAVAFFFREQWFFSILATATSALVGWPFAALLGLPVVLEMIFLRKELLKFIMYAAACGVAICSMLIYVDSYYFGKLVLAPLNIILYNVFSEHGANLYGEEPFSFYIKNLFLNHNLAFPFAAAAVPLSAIAYIWMSDGPSAQKLPKNKYSLAYWKRYMSLLLVALSMAAWFIVFAAQKHKEERFMYPIYPLISMFAAVALDAFRRLFERIFKWTSTIIWIIIGLFIIISLSRSFSLHRNYGAHIEVYNNLNAFLTDEAAPTRDFSHRKNDLQVCVGKEWYRFPSSFFLPQRVLDKHGNTLGVNLQFLKSEFRGLLPKYYEEGRIPNITQSIPTEMNDKNKEEPSRYVPIEACDLIVDLDVPSDMTTTLEPNFSTLMSDESSQASTANSTKERDEAIATEMNSKIANLVKIANSLPKLGDDFELCNSFPAFSAFMHQQEVRIQSLIQRCMETSGCPVKAPKVGSSIDDYMNKIIAANDSILERTGICMDAVEKAHRDEQVLVPKTIIGAESTKAASIRQPYIPYSSLSTPLPANLPGLLKQARERSDALKAANIAVARPQKDFNIVIDNSRDAFISKLRIKHNARELPRGNVIIDLDNPTENIVTSTEDIEITHPYRIELDHFKIPQRQLESVDEPPRSLEETTLTVVNTKEGLERLLDVLNKEQEFAVDLEHNNQRSFLGITCLMQISTRTTDYIVDPFPIWGELHVLNEPFSNPNILKLEYARCDTHYLLHCYDRCREDLIEKGNEFNNLLKAVYDNSAVICGKPYEKPPFDALGYEGLLTAKRTFNSQQVYALKELWTWRDNIARAEDESVNYVLPTNMMLNICDALPREAQGIAACCNPVPEMVKKHLLDLHKIIYSARDQPLILGFAQKKNIMGEEGSFLQAIIDEQNRMTKVKSILRCNLDFTHSPFDEEIGKITIKDDQKMVPRKSAKNAYFLLDEIGDKTVVVPQLTKSDEKLLKKIVAELEEWSTPFERYSIGVKKAVEQEAKRKEEEEKKKKEMGIVEKKMFSHHDPINPKPKDAQQIAAMDDVEFSAERVETTFTQEETLTKKGLARKRKQARKAADINLDGNNVKVKLEEEEVEEDEDGIDFDLEGSAGPSKKLKKETIEPVDYSQYDPKMFYQEPKKDEFDPFHQQIRKDKKNWKNKRGRGRGGRGGGGLGRGGPRSTSFMPRT